MIIIRPRFRRIRWSRRSPLRIYPRRSIRVVNGETPSVVTGLVLTRAPGTVPGTYAITPSGAVAENYFITFVNGTLTITEPTTNITAKLRRPVSKLLEARVPGTFARPSLNGGRGDVGLNMPGCDPYTCLSVDVLLPQSGEVSVSIYDNLGVPVILWSQVVSDVELASLPKTEDGRHVARLTWNLRSESGRAVPEGVYLWKLEARLKDGTKLENVYKLGVKK
ncbi:MAG: domain type [Fibrobacterota bacterium]